MRFPRAVSQVNEVGFVDEVDFVGYIGFAMMLASTWRAARAEQAAEKE